jgi:2-hydroxy-3-keto-5-methylthiopentenyl-1-phosphate phosphatase
MKRMKTMQKKLVLLSDFDGTVVDIDTGAYVLDEFANSSWRDIEEQFTRDEITFEECLKREFAMINHPKDEILKSVENATTVRDHFDDVVKCCRERNIELKLVSGGLDFCIKHILEKNHLDVDVIAPKTTFTVDGLKLEFPKLSNVTCFSFKDDTVRRYQRLGFNVAYVGDGYADYYAIKESNLRFAINDSVSARLCQANKIVYVEIADFEPVLKILN